VPAQATPEPASSVPLVVAPQAFVPAPPANLWTPAPPANLWTPPAPANVWKPYVVPRRPRRGRAVPLLVGAIVTALIATLGVAAGQWRPPPEGATALGPVASKLSDATRGDERDLNVVLSAQSQALLDGDETGFLAVVDPAATSAVAAYKRLYANLRALRVTAWTQRSDDGDSPILARRSFTIGVSYCLLVDTCRFMDANFVVSAADVGGRALIESYTPPRSSRRLDEPIPWESSALTVVTGPRVIIAAAASEKSALARALPIAERAAVAADNFAHWGKPPIYLVYLAGPHESVTWFGGAAKNTLGEAMSVSDTDIEVMVVMPVADETRYAGAGALATVIQHEMGHVATLYGDEQNSVDDSLVEGIAEYIAYTGHPTWATERLADAHEYIRRGRWSGSCYLTKEIASNDVLTSSAAYGIGYLTIKRLVAKYGTAKMLDFWDDIEREWMTPQMAAEEALGVSWHSVNADCASYVHHTLHV
jgi:hypothetical protein